VDSHVDSLAARHPIAPSPRMDPKTRRFLPMPRTRPTTGALVAALALLVLLVGAACNSNGSSASRGPNSISIVDDNYSPSTLTVKAGTTVEWTNTGSHQHTVTADDGSFDSGFLNGGATFSQTFASAGTFAFHCNVHSSMHGTITVTP
jgi:plastocyanin